MNSLRRGFVLLILAGLASVGVAQADDSNVSGAMTLASASYPNRTSSQDNGAIRRANPNSRQGTESIAPSVRGVTPGAAQQRPPTLENGGIGNGYPTRQQSPRPSVNGSPTRP